MRLAILLSLLLVLQLTSAKTITFSNIEITADDLFKCNLAYDKSDGYAQCHNYISIKRTSGSTTLNNIALFQNFTEKNIPIRNVKINSVTATAYNETNYLTECILIDKINNITDCHPIPYNVSKLAFSNPQPLTSSITFNTVPKWYDLYFEMPNFQDVSWNFSIKSGVIQVVLDPNTTAACGNIAVANQIYLLNQSISGAGNCIDVLVDNVILDCYGFTISSTNNAANSYGVRVSGHKNVTIKNCDIRGFQSGVYFLNANNTELYNVNVSSQKQTVNLGNSFVYGVRAENVKNLTMNLMKSNYHNATSTYSGACLGVTYNAYNYGYYFFNASNVILNNSQSLNQTGNYILGLFDPEIGSQCISRLNINKWSYYLNNVTSSSFKYGYENAFNHIDFLTSTNNYMSDITSEIDPINLVQLIYAYQITTDSKNNIFQRESVLNSTMAYITFLSRSHNNVVLDSTFHQTKYTGGSSSAVFNIASGVNNITVQNTSFLNFSERLQINIDNTTDTEFLSNTFVGINESSIQPNTINLCIAADCNRLIFDRNTFTNMSWNSFAIIYSVYNSMNNTNFTNNIITNFRGTPYYLSGKNITVENDSLVNVGSGTLLDLGAAGNSIATFRNVTGFNSTKVTYTSNNQNSNLTVQWFVAANVTDVDKVPLTGALVNITNSTSTSPETLNLQTTNGLTQYALVTEMIGNNTVKVTYTPHLFFVSKSSSYIAWNSNSTNYTITSTQVVPLILSTQVVVSTTAQNKKLYNSGFISNYQSFSLMRRIT